MQMKYTLGSGVTQFKGSVGGITFQKCGKVFSARKRAIPVDKKSARQTRARNGFESQASRYNSLTAGQKLSWVTNAPLWPRTNSLGVSYNQSARNMQIGTNQKRLFMAIGVTATTNPPAAFTTLTILNWSLQFNPHDMRVSVFPDLIQTGFNVNYYVSRPVSPGQSVDRNTCAFMGTRSQGNLSSAFNWYNTYIALFPLSSKNVGQRVQVFAELVQRNAGQVVQTLSGSIEITLL